MEIWDTSIHRLYGITGQSRLILNHIINNICSVSEIQAYFNDIDKEKINEILKNFIAKKIVVKC